MPSNTNSKPDLGISTCTDLTFSLTRTWRSEITSHRNRHTTVYQYRNYSLQGYKISWSVVIVSVFVLPLFSLWCPSVNSLTINNALLRINDSVYSSTVPRTFRPATPILLPTSISIIIRYSILAFQYTLNLKRDAPQYTWRIKATSSS